MTTETYHRYELRCEHTRLQRILNYLQKASVEISQSNFFFLTPEENIRFILLQRKLNEASLDLDKHLTKHDNLNVN